MTGSNDPTILPTPSPNPDEATLPSATFASGSQLNQVALSQFGDYQLEEEIARGGMGVVYKARQLSLNRTVALKMILSGQFASEADVRRFYQEAESAANLDHPGIVPIYDIGEYEGHHFFSMKYVEGGSLAAALPDLRNDTRRVVQLIASVCRAVHHAHQRGILHRDLKPANILLDQHGSPLVSDLGLAKQIQSDSKLTHTGAIVGTPAYMPPEQAAAKKEITTAADIYALGAILYEVLVGRPPHKGETPMETLLQVMEGKVTPPREVDRSVPRAPDLICMKCLQLEPEQRYSSAAALADDLENWLDGKTVSVRPPSLLASLGGALLSNVRSAFGAGIVGIVAGLLLAVCLGEGYTEGSLVANPPSKIYAALPGEIPWGRSLIYFNESGDREGLLVIIGFLVAMLTVGFCVTAVTRPRPGPAALAMGLIAAIMMTTTAFVFNLGPMAFAQRLSDDVIPRIDALGRVALGTEEQAGAAKTELEEEFPQLSELPVEHRAKTLAYRVFYESFFRMPSAIIGAFLVSSLFCFLPSLLGTTFCSKLLAEKGQLHRTALPYLEFMVAVFVTTLCCFAFMVLNRHDESSVGNLSEPPPLQIQALTLLVLATLAWAFYQRWIGWRTRTVLYGGLLSLILVIAKFG